MQSKRILLVFLILFLCSYSLLSQEQLLNSIAPSGGEASGTGGSASFTAGQMGYTSFENDMMQMQEGVQQAAIEEIYTLKIIENVGVLQIAAYPNPVIDVLTLTMKYRNMEDVSYQLYDMQGRLITKNYFHQSTTTIALGYLQPATYLLKVLDHDVTLKIIKVIKT
ncbi:T9SS type A sorting domain-containing protein [Flavimarina sp. Hel_I_48]|uniref:T9SS type A sorting domain-containing protein n=1 Tax=Flavimarina sp. Hel_I_48 TaxID=1392488 RepID=UPI0004DEEA6B|nr:T9SS type A sorting domain-containing protein [Flavimarina sp. Hel_I_48]